MLRRLLFSFPALLALHAVAASGPPAETDVRKSIESAFTETYVDPVVWKITKIKCEFSAMKMGKQTSKQIQYGKSAEPVWPVKVEVKYRGDEAHKTVTRGAGANDVFFFYKDAFDEWRFKTGSL